MISYVHFPVISVMGLFLTAFLVEIFGSHSKIIRNILTVGMTGAACVMIFSLIKPVMIDGEIISYWMGNWEPVEGIAIGIGYEVDALSLFFALITVVTFFLSGIYSLKYMEDDSHLGHYYTLMLMLSGSVLGLTMTGDIFNMFVMIEITCFAGSALIAFRNKEEGAVEGGLKYLLIDSIGSKLLLAGIALLYMQAHTLNMAQLASVLHNTVNPLTVFAFALMFGGFGVKSFMVPFHTPEADAQSVAPASVSMMLSGMVMKAGVYGMIRLVYVIFMAMDLPAVQILLTAFGTVTMFVGVTMALAQHNVRRLLAFHSISQIGYVMAAAGLGTALGLTGALFHAVNHTLFKGLLFLCMGSVIRAAGTGDLDKLGGLSKKMPKTCIAFLIGALSISGIPAFNGFASKWMIYQAAYEKGIATGNFFYVIVCVVAVVVSSLTLASFVKVTHAVFFGQCPESCKDVKEAPFLQRLPQWILAILCFVTGVFYEPFMKYILTPAANAALNAVGYINAMMGAGYAESAGIANIYAVPAEFSYWNPMVWLVLFAVIMLAALVVIATGKSERGKVVTATPETAADDKHAVFFGGEKSVYSHVKGSDLFWGLKYSWRDYFGFIENAHTGVINDYSLWIVCAFALIIAYVFAFVL